MNDLAHAKSAIFTVWLHSDSGVRHIGLGGSLLASKTWVLFPERRSKMVGGLGNRKFGDIKNDRIILYALSLFAFLLFIGAQKDFGYITRIVIPVGAGDNQIQWTEFSENDWRVSIKFFAVADDGQIYLGEPGTNKVKVFNLSGNYLRTFSDFDTYPVFLNGSQLCGLKRSGVGSNEELFVFRTSDGSLLYRRTVPFKGPLWTAYAMEGGKLYYSSAGIAAGQIRFYDMEKQIFSSNKGLKQYSNDDLNDVSDQCNARGYEQIGRISDCLIYRNVECPENNGSCLHLIIAARKKGGKITEAKLLVKEDEIGYYMPDVPWILFKERYVFTIGYSRTGSRPGDKLFISKIDLMKALPNIF